MPPVQRRPAMTTSCVLPLSPQQPLEDAMSRYLAPLGFTLVATWVATVFLLVAK
jgi:hypothetical protein